MVGGSFVFFDVPCPVSHLLTLFIHSFIHSFSHCQRANAHDVWKGPNVSECTINGKPVKAVAGQKVSQVAAAARVKITYSCKKGDCGTCEVMQNGRIVKACQAKINSGKCDIRTL